MFLSVAVSRAEVASSRSNNFGDLEKKNISGDIVHALKNATLTRDYSFAGLCLKICKTAKVMWVLGTGHKALGTGNWALGTGPTNLRKVLAIATLCFSPPLSLRPRSPTFVS